MRVSFAILLAIAPVLAGAPAVAADIEFCDPVWHAASSGDRTVVLERLRRAGALDPSDRFICSTIGSEMTRQAQGPADTPGSGAPALAALGPALCNAKHLFQEGLCARRPQGEREACAKTEQARFDRVRASCE